METVTIQNPYASTVTSDGKRRVPGDVRPSSFSPHLAALLLTLIGAPVGAVLCSIGYLLVILILESAFVPPLKSPENYGQFGFVLIVLGFFGLIYGASLGLIPYTRLLLWFPAFLLISFFVFSVGFDGYFDATEVTCTAMIVIGVFIVLLAAMSSQIVGRFDARTPTKPRIVASKSTSNGIIATEQTDARES